MTFQQGQRVRHSELGQGIVEADLGQLVIVSFPDGMEKVPAGELVGLSPVEDLVARSEWQSPLRVITRVQAEAILSAHGQWGVFSRSRISLYPHQLWVCRRVMERWPARRLIADDVGLGKTVEAGLIISALRRRGLARRVLVLCPASLVEQWQERLRTMFDLRFNLYTREADTPRSEFWNSNNAVVASLQSMRMENEAQQRLAASDPWDLVIVDEAHHLNADEQRGNTLGYRLLERLNKANRIHSLLLFTGTPHRGKVFGFLSLMHLLNPEIFDPKRAPKTQYAALGEYLIRNNKHNVTDLQGRALFTPNAMSAETYSYAPAEEEFYQKLTQFIVTGEAYARTLSERDGRAVMLVLITMQKLASSSVAAIRRALRRRLAAQSKLRESLMEGRQTANGSTTSLLARMQDPEAQIDDEDGLRELEEKAAGEDASLSLMVNEEARLRELLHLAEQITRETKVQKLLDLLDGRLAGRSVLFFTEYKATQSMLMGELIQRYGRDSVVFINGDEQAEEVRLADGSFRTIRMSREDAAEQFNAGKARFLISTEAGGEGIDLQEQCSTLIHVDLPWNPMRMHQRVGRLNRLGQKERVEVISLRNPDTVEDRIWSKLNEKIESIMSALHAAMPQPEDLFQLVLGATGPGYFEHLYSQGAGHSGKEFDSWFDRETASFGGQDSLETVRELVGRADRFDFEETSALLPRVDLPDLKTFFLSVLQLSGRRAREEGDGELRFTTPERWTKSIGVDAEYEGLHFDRKRKGRAEAVRLLGCGHKLMDLALDEAREFTESLAVVRALEHPLLVFALRDGVTVGGGDQRRTVAALELRGDDPASWRLLRDWELLKDLNQAVERGGRPVQIISPSADADTIISALSRGMEMICQRAGETGISFTLVEAELLAIFWPAAETA